MAVIQSMNALAQTGVEPAISNSGVTTAGGGGQGLFGSIFSKVVETANQSGEVNSGEAPAVKNEAKNAVGTQAGSTARLGALVQQLAVMIGREKHESRSVAETIGNKVRESGTSCKRKTRVNAEANAEVTDQADPTQADQTRVDDPAQVSAVLGQVLNELKVSLDSGTLDTEDGSERILIEKSVVQIAKKLEELKKLPETAVADARPAGASVATQNNETGESRKNGVDRNVNSVPGLPGNVKVRENDSLSQIADTLKQIVGQSDVEKIAAHGDNEPVKGSMAGVAREEDVSGAGFPYVNRKIEKAGGNDTPTAGMSRFSGSQVIKAEITTHEPGEMKAGSRVLQVNDGNITADRKTGLSGQVNRKLVTGSLPAGYHELQWKTPSEASPSPGLRDTSPKVGKTMMESPMKNGLSTEQGIVTGKFTGPSETSLSSALKVVLSKGEQSSAGTSATKEHPVERKVVSDKVVNEGNANDKPATIKAEALESGESPVFRAAVKEQSNGNDAEKPDQPGNSGNAAGIEARVKSASLSAGASGEQGNPPGKGEEKGKGNVKFPEVNISIRSQGVSVLSSAKAEALSDDQAKNMSHEQILTQVREKLAETPLKGDSGVISLKLHPEELGELKLNVRLEDQKLKVEVITENRVVKDVLAQNLGSLRETLSRHNLTMEKFDVFTAGNDGSNQQFREGRHSAQNPHVHRYDGYSAPAEDDRQVTAKYLDQGENSLVDVRF